MDDDQDRRAVGTSDDYTLMVSPRTAPGRCGDQRHSDPTGESHFVGPHFGAVTLVSGYVDPERQGLPTAAGGAHVLGIARRHLGLIPVQRNVPVRTDHRNRLCRNGSRRIDAAFSAESATDDSSAVRRALQAQLPFTSTDACDPSHSGMIPENRCVVLYEFAGRPASVVMPSARGVTTTRER